ncbi:MAG: HD domain-containing protein [Oligoflexia bacterium]|nr:HD domain-containing protein [Oligoflexia bacterium]
MNSSENEYKQIQLLDILPNQVLAFDVYIFLPANNKYVKYINENDTMDEDQIQRLKFKKINELFIHKFDIDKYNRYVSSNIRALLDTDNQQKRQEAIKSAAELIINSVDILSSDGDIIEWNNNCIELTKTVIDDIVKTEDIGIAYDKISEYLSGSPSLASHSLIVSSLGVIFAMSLGNTAPRTLTEISFGGLVHDIGLGDIPTQVAEKYLTKDEMTLVEVALLKEHPRKGINILQKIIRSKNITDNVLKIVFEHHENVCGKGYPQGLAYDDLSYLPKIISIADKVSFEMLDIDKEDISLKYIILKIIREQESKGYGKELLDKRMLKALLESLSHGRTK